MLQTRSSQKPSSEKIQVIAHRGLSSILPQNTMEAIIAGIQCSDYVEFDVMLTQDDEVIVFHDEGLKRLTNVCQLKEFAQRKRFRCVDVDKEKQQDWWVDQFTFDQLSKLVVKQPHAFRPQFPQVFRISKFEDIIRQCIKIKNTKHHKQTLRSGLLIELKSSKIRLPQKEEQLCLAVSQILKKFNLNTLQGCKKLNLPIVLQSFNIQMLQSLERKCENQFIQLFLKDTNITQDFLNKIKSDRIRGIGITEKSLLNVEGKICRRLKQILDKLGYRLYYWTIRDDDETNIPFKCKTYDEVYRLLRENGVDGFITQFPDKCKGIFRIESAQYFADLQEIAEKCPRRQSSKQLKMISPAKRIQSAQSL